jgi:hypothetical protein
MTGRMERWKSKLRFTTFPPPLGNLAKTRRDSHIPAPPTAGFFEKNQKPLTWNRTKCVNHVPGLKCQLSPRPYREDDPERRRCGTVPRCYQVQR